MADYRDDTLEILSEGEIIERGTVPCLTCLRPHAARQLLKIVSWADPEDLHSYRMMSAEQVVAFVRAGGSV